MGLDRIDEGTAITRHIQPPKTLCIKIKNKRSRGRFNGRLGLDMDLLGIYSL